MDAEGLSQAYASASGFHRVGDTVYVAGTRLYGHGLTQALSDIRDDSLLPGTSVIPGMGTTETRKYKQLAGYLRSQEGVRTLTGHSLGASVSRIYAEKHGLHYRSYASPSVSWHDDPNSFRHVGDLISVFDRGAQDSLPSSFNAHSYA